MSSNSLLGTFLSWLRGPERQATPQSQPDTPGPQPQQYWPPQQSHTPAQVAPQPRRLPYARNDRLLTISEGDFFAVLRQALPPGHQLFVQVRLAGLVRVQPWTQHDKSHWYRIQAKCVDFVVCDERTFAPRLVVELDDASHDREDRQARDAFVDEVLAGVGLPILHVRWQRQYSQAALAGQVLAALGGRAGEAPAEQLWQPIPAAPAANPAPAPVAASQLAQATVAEQRRQCGQCRVPLRPGARFCSQCGATFSRGS